MQVQAVKKLIVQHRGDEPGLGDDRLPVIAEPVLFGCGLLVLAWVIALLDGSNLRQGMPEHFSWAPNPSRNSGNANVRKIMIDENQPGAAVGPGLGKL